MICSGIKRMSVMENKKQRGRGKQCDKTDEVREGGKNENKELSNNKKVFITNICSAMRCHKQK